MSLLLDALKKAALEKQRREQPGAQAAKPIAPAADLNSKSTPVPTTPEKPTVPELKIEPMAENLIEEKTLSVESTIAETQMDLGKLNPELEALAIEQPEANAVTQEDGLVFDINDIDPEFLQPDTISEPDAAPDLATDTESSQAEFLPGTGIVEDFVRRASEQHAHEEALSLSTDEKVALQEVAAQPSPPPAIPEPTLTESLSPQGQQPVPEPTAVVEAKQVAEASAEPVQVAPQKSDEKSLEDIKALLDEKPQSVEAFSASSGKAALAQLLERSKKAANAARKRMMLMYAFLSVTAILMVVFYYYLLHSDAANLVATVPQAPVVTEEVAPEVAPEAEPDTALAEDSVSAAEDAALAAANSEIAGEVDAGQTPSVMPEPKAPASQRQIKETGQANQGQVSQPQAVTRKAPKPAATHEVLPAATPAKQAMVVERNPAVDEVSEAIDRGYQAYQRGDISAAEEAYREALRQDPYQRDAMLGAAAVAVRQGRQEDALNIYQQRLAREPKDQYAQSGILALSENTEQNPELDSELSRLLLEYPEAGHLHFLKGSLYAARQQWAAAQVSFFEAWQRDNKNPDLAFNLAVALDHLAQPKEAARFYRQALTLGSTRPASFSAEAAQSRLNDLEGAVHPEGAQ